MPRATRTARTAAALLAAGLKVVRVTESDGTSDGVVELTNGWHVQVVSGQNFYSLVLTMPDGRQQFFPARRARSIGSVVREAVARCK